MSMRYLNFSPPAPQKRFGLIGFKSGEPEIESNREVLHEYVVRRKPPLTRFHVAYSPSLRFRIFQFLK